MSSFIRYLPAAIVSTVHFYDLYTALQTKDKNEPPHTQPLAQSDGISPGKTRHLKRTLTFTDQDFPNIEFDPLYVPTDQFRLDMGKRYSNDDVTVLVLPLDHEYNRLSAKQKNFFIENQKLQAAFYAFETWVKTAFVFITTLTLTVFVPLKPTVKQLIGRTIVFLVATVLMRESERMAIVAREVTLLKKVSPFLALTQKFSPEDLGTIPTASWYKDAQKV